MDGPRVAAGVSSARDPPFELVFRLDARDHQALLRNMRWRVVERAAALLPGFAIAALGAVVGLFAVLAFDKTDALAWFLAAAVGGALILYVLHRLVLMRLYYRSLFAGQPMALGDTKVVIDMRGIAANMAEIVIAMPWSCIVRIVETDQHIFLMFARLAGVIVPKRAFTSADQVKRFAAFARSMAPSARR
jgi:hypothetical protein